MSLEQTTKLPALFVSLHSDNYLPSLLKTNLLFWLRSQKRHRLVASCQFYRRVNNCNNLSISSSFNKSVKIRFVATCHLHTCYNLLKQFAASLWITSFDNQHATSLLTTCNRLVVNKLSQGVRAHPDIGLLFKSIPCKM